MERDEVVLLVEPLIGLRLVFQTEVPADLLGRIERVDVSRLETGRVAVRVCIASMFVGRVRQCFSAVWADGFPRCRHRFPVM